MTRKKYSFTNRTVIIWNSLPEQVFSSGSVNIFKNRLDTFLHDQDIVYNWEADVTGTGGRSGSVDNVYNDSLK